MAQPLKNLDSGYDTHMEQLRPSQMPDQQTARSEKQAYQALHIGYVAAPLIAGIDKFFDVLGNWDGYLAPVLPRILGISPHTFMMGVGVVEIVAGIGVALKPRIFGYVVSGWLGGIIVNLLIRGAFYDVALRDLGLSIGAFALARLATRFDRSARLGV